MLDSIHSGATRPADGIGSTFSEWALSHRSMGGDFDENALQAGIQASVTAYRGGLAPQDAFEIGRQAFYSALP